MPNWAYNKLTITLKDIKQKDNYLKLLNNLKWGTLKAGLDFNIYVPYSELISKAEYDFGGWNEWCTKNWGTKWNACSFKIEKDNSEFGQIEFSFDTAWATPMPVIREMSSIHTGVEFKIEATYENEDGIYKGKYRDGIYYG